MFCFMAETLERPILVEGKTFDDIPSDLYIPPDYLEVFLERFEGPLDLLLYLIRKRNFDLLNLPIVKITEQYLQYLDIMRDKDMDIAIEYLVMAATLIQLKSRLLLPRKTDLEQGEEEDPRALLAARLLAYEKTQAAAELLDSYKRLDRDFTIFSFKVHQNSFQDRYLCDTDDLLQSYKNILNNAKIHIEHKVEAEKMTLQEGMLVVLESVQNQSCYFHDIIKTLDQLNSVICCFSGLLELAKQRVVMITQHEPLGEIFIQLVPQKESTSDANTLSE